MSRLMRVCMTGLFGMTTGLLLQGTWDGRLYGQCTGTKVGMMEKCGCDAAFQRIVVCQYGNTPCEEAATDIPCDGCGDYVGTAGTCGAAPSQSSAAASLSRSRGLVSCESSSLSKLEEWVKSHPIIAKVGRPALQASR